MGLKILAYGILGYVRDIMNVMDGIIVIISLSELFFIDNGLKALSSFRTVRVFRTFRVLRITKLLRSMAFMQVIIGKYFYNIFVKIYLFSYRSDIKIFVIFHVHCIVSVFIHFYLWITWERDVCRNF